MKIKKDRKETKSFKELFLERFSDMTVKSYLIETGTYIKKHMLKATLIILAITLLSVVSVVKSPEMFKLDKADVAFWGEWLGRAQVLIIIVFAGIVPYMYIPIIGLASSISAECIYFANYVSTVGRLKGTLGYITPYILNMLFIAAATALGLHICRNVTISQRITSIKSKNSMDIKIKWYEATNKKAKMKEIEKQRKDKIKALEDKKVNVDLFQIINITAIICVLQMLASLVKTLVV